MMLEERTDTIVRHEGMNLLIKHLGPVDAERFIALMNREPFDYTEWRRNNLADEDVRSLSKKSYGIRNEYVENVINGTVPAVS